MMAAFSQHQIVWARRPPTAARPGDLWWPATMEQEEDEGGQAAVRFVGAKNRKRVSAGDVVNFDLLLGGVQFADPELDAATKEAAAADRQTGSFPRIVLRRCRGDESNVEHEGEEKGVVEFPATSMNKEEDKENDAPEEHVEAERASSAKRAPLQELNKKRKSQAKEETEELSEYEKIRLRNIAERREMFAALMACKTSLVTKLSSHKPKSRTPRKYQHRIPYSSRTEPVCTRRRSRLNSGGSSYVTSEDSTPRKRFHEEYSSDEDDDDRAGQKRRSFVRRDSWIHDPNTNILAPEEVTDEMLENVADRVSEKVYNQSRGTTCHQCRQKTLDTKTACRSGHCVGIRGMFCGVCLLNRYGENAREVLKDPNWMCPPCLDVCNCSICRNRIGKGATGPITYLAHSKGFRSVRDFLDSLRKGRKGEEIFHDDE